MARRILVVEDEAPIREMVCFVLEQNGFQPVEAEDYDSAVNQLNEPWPDLILLDWMLPGGSGLQFIKHLKREAMTRDIPVMMLTAKGSEYDKGVGLDMGADDYMTKPFGMMELIARVKALLRRTKESGKNDNVNTLNIGCLSVIPSKYSVKVGGEKVVLTLKEFDLLCLLLQNKGTVFTRDKLLNKIWGYDFDGESRTVDVHVRTLRQKLGEAGKYIETVRGIGYKIGD